MRPNKIDDVWRYVIRRDRDQCWPYKGSRANNGYGRFSFERKAIGAHRAAYEAVNGVIPAGLLVLHKCNNKLCCNPSHLTTGTNSENQRHASSSNAFPVGRSGMKGISFDRRRGYWTAQGYLNGKKRNLYTGPHKEKAISARKRWEQQNDISFNQTETSNANV